CRPPAARSSFRSFKNVAESMRPTLAPDELGEPPSAPATTGRLSDSPGEAEGRNPASRAKECSGEDRVDARPAANAGACQPSPGRRLDAHVVVEVNNTASEAALGQEFELGANVVWQCALSTTHDDRSEEQVALVD